MPPIVWAGDGVVGVQFLVPPQAQVHVFSLCSRVGTDRPLHLVLGLGLSIWKSKKDKRNGKKKSKTGLDDTSDNDDPIPEPEKKPKPEIVYRGQAGGARSGRGMFNVPHLHLHLETNRLC